MSHHKKEFEKNEVYFYYVPKNSKNRMRIDFGSNNHMLGEKYFLEGMFIPHEGFLVPPEDCIKFKRERMSEINGDFVKFKKNTKPYVSNNFNKKLQ